MTAGEIILSVVAACSALGCLKLLADAQDWARENEAFGDWPYLPEEAKRRAADTMPGGGADNAARAQGFAHDIAHRDGSVTP